MEERTLKALDFPKILRMLAEQAICEETKTKCLTLLPSTDIYAAERLLKETSEADSIIIKKGNPPISPVKNVSGALFRSENGGVLSMGELLNIAHVLRISRVISDFLPGDEFEENFPAVFSSLSGIYTDKRLEKLILNSIISDEEMADDASPELLSIRRKMKSLQAKVREVLEGMLRSGHISPLLQEQIITMRDNRYVIPVKSEHKGEVPGIVHDSSASGATLFVEPMAVVDINNKLKALSGEEKEEIEKILMHLSEETADCAGSILSGYNTLVEIDFIFARGKLSRKMNAEAPALNTSGIINIKEGRHPLIGEKEVVPTDIYLGDKFDTLVITGPNTGGKTVSLKTLGLFTLMAQSGLCIPARSGSEMAVFENVFADVGDEQSIEQSLSTFSAHMKNIIGILEKADYKSLILFDELGAGTDPTEGAALAVAILERARALGAKVAATTHYSEIKLYALSNDRVENAACEFDIKSLKPTYRLLIGVPGKSNAFAISKRLGLSEDIIERARTLIDGESTRFEDIISSLEKSRQEAERELSAASIAKAETLAQRESAVREKEIIEKQKEKILSDARRDAKKIYENAKAEADKIVKEMQKLLNDASADNKRLMEENRHKLKKSYDNITDDLSEDVFNAKNAERLDPQKLILGQEVNVTTMDQTGNLLSLPDKKGDLFVQVGILKIKTNINALAPVKKGKKNKTAVLYTSGEARSPSSVKQEIDLRGQSVDDALIMADKYLDDAAMANLQSVSIIHGKGTGALRSAVSEMLRHNPHVKSFRAGRFGEGENGVTIVELK